MLAAEAFNTAIETLAALPGEAWLVLGDMRELGADAEALHVDAGRRAKSAGLSRLYALGELSAAAALAFGDGARSFQSHATLAEAVREDLLAHVLQGNFLRGVEGASAPMTIAANPVGAEAPPTALRILVKGSRGSAMDRVVSRLLVAWASAPGEGATHVA